MPKASEPSKVKVGVLVFIPYLNEKGVICSGPDPKGRIRALIKGKKLELPVKRMKLLTILLKLVKKGDSHA